MGMGRGFHLQIDKILHLVIQAPRKYLQQFLLLRLPLALACIVLQRLQ
jgi:hypothetical protein